jgi:hypothetical protein
VELHVLDAGRTERLLTTGVARSPAWTGATPGGMTWVAEARSTSLWSMTLTLLFPGSPRVW